MAAGRYKIRTISARTGFSPELLRAWERRHRLLSPERTSGGQRLYSEQDLRLLLHLRARLAQGSAIGELAARGRRALLREAEREGDAPAPPEPAPGTDNLRRWAEEVVRGAVDIDEVRIERALDEAYARLSPAAVAHGLVRPAAYEIGRLWSLGACSVAGEHLASGAFVRRLLRQLELSQDGRAGPASVVACVAGEQHAVGALVVANDLARAGRGVRYLGASLPAPDLERAARVLEAPAVFLSSTIPELLAAQKEQLADVARRLGPGVSFHLGGQAVPPADAELEQAGVHLHPSAAPDRRSET